MNGNGNSLTLAVEYQLYCEWAERTNYGQRLDEFSLRLPTWLKDRIDFLKELALELKVSFVDTVKLFLDKHVFTLFQKIGWSFKSLYDLLKQGFQLYRKLTDLIAEFIKKHLVGEWTQQKIEELSAWLEKNPNVKRVVGVGVAALLIYIWLTMTFTGDFDEDFDLSMVWMSLTGKYNLAQIFVSTSGIKMLTLFATGALLNLSFPWPGSGSAKFTVAVMFSIAKSLKKKLSKKNISSIENEIEKV